MRRKDGIVDAGTCFVSRLRATNVSLRSRSEILKQFGANLREHRTRTGLSQEKLATKAGIDRTYVGGAERGERNVALVNIVRLAEALGVTPAELLANIKS